MKIEPDAEAGKILLPLAEKKLSFGEWHFLKANAVTGGKLRRQRHVHRDHVRHLRIAADGLAISQQKNRSPIWRDLDRAGRNGFRQQIPTVTALQLRPFKTRTHPIGIGGDRERICEQRLLCLLREALPICSSYNAQHRVLVLDNGPNRWCTP